MTESTAALPSAPNPFDNWRSITIALFMGLVGYTVMVSVPVLSTALVMKAGFTEPEVGRIWGNDLLGLSIGAVFASFCMGRLNRRLLVLIGVVLSIGANGLCMIMTGYEEMMALRMLAGIGSGIFTAVGVASLGATTRPEHAFNLLLFGFAFSTALELNFLPYLTMNQIYIVFMVLAGICALFVMWVPARPLDGIQLAAQQLKRDDGENWHVPRYMPVMCLVAVCFTYMNIGGYYTYIQLAAMADGLTEAWSGNVLTWSSFLAVVGCAIAWWASRFGLFKPLFISLVLMGAVVAAPALGINEFILVLSVFGFMTMWTFIDVYQSAMLGYMDSRGSIVALLPAVQGFGQFLGPNIAASILEAELGYPVMFMVSGALALVALGLYMTVAALMHRRSPAVAEPA